jgi:hypothetical protein
MWPNIGAADLTEPYENTCSDEAFPIEEVNRLLNIYVVSFFKQYLHGEQGYGTYLTTDYASEEPAIELSMR